MKKVKTHIQRIQAKYSWDDLNLTQQCIQELKYLISHVDQQKKLAVDYRIAGDRIKNVVITALFTGENGTGKAMAAEVIAKELNKDVYRIDLSQVVSKYIGETEKNLEKIFKEAETSNAILFFDEADSLFGKRSEVKDAHERYANIEISYLLQKMEEYVGLVILATNNKSMMGDTFIRRLRFVIDFPFPEEDKRIPFWVKLLRRF